VSSKLKGKTNAPAPKTLKGPRINLAKLQAAREQHQQSHGLYVLSGSAVSQTSPFLPLKATSRSPVDLEEVEKLT